jgi:hypothetical protein
VAKTRQVGDGDVLILNVSCYVSGTLLQYNVFPLIFQRAEGQCGSAHKTVTTLSVLRFKQPPCFSESLSLNGRMA